MDHQIKQNETWIRTRQKKHEYRRRWEIAKWKTRRGLFSLAIIGLMLFALSAGSGMGIYGDIKKMDFLQADQTLQVQPGDTVIIPWDTQMNEGYFTNNQSAPFRFIATYSYPDGTKTPADKTLASVTLSPGQVYGGSHSVTMPNVSGTYKIRIYEELKLNSSSTIWTKSGCFTVTLLVVEQGDNSIGNNSTGNNSIGNNSTGNDSTGNNSVINRDEDGNVILPKQDLSGGFVTWVFIGVLVVLSVVLVIAWPRNNERGKQIQNVAKRRGNADRRQNQMKSGNKMIKRSR